MNTVILVFFAPMLAAGVVTLPAIYMDTLGGLQGIVVGYAASWLSAVLLSILAYAKYAQEIKGVMGRLIFDTRTHRVSRS